MIKTSQNIIYNKEKNASSFTAKCMKQKHTMRNKNDKINEPNNCQKTEAKNTRQDQQQMIKKQYFLSI